MNEITYKPIGIVHSPHSFAGGVGPHHLGRHGVEGTVEVFPEFAEGLRDLDSFSHIILLCHLHLSKGFALSVTPPGTTGTHGLFGTRSPRRPNPISLTVVRLQRIEGAILHVVDLDLVDGTPLLDIKPYFTAVPVDEVVTADWMAAHQQVEP